MKLLRHLPMSSAVAALIVSVRVSSAIAQDAASADNGSASGNAARRYEAAGESYQGGNHVPDTEENVNFIPTVVRERNVFALRARDIPVNAATGGMAGPKPDLLLIGVCNLDDVRCAIFKLTEPAKPPSCFTLKEGEQNEWLEIVAIDAPAGWANVRLKKPVMRIQNPGAGIIITVQPAGR